MTALIRTLVLALALVVGVQFAHAQSDEPVSSGAGTTAVTEPMSKISFPIAELGNCESRQACKLYCDQSANRDACFSYAQKSGLMNKEKVVAAKLLLSKKGPGGCDSKDSCRTYCSDSSHQEECLTFAKTNKVITDDRAAFIRKVTTGEAPGACKSAETCKMYCEDPTHRDECRAFAEANGLVRKVASSTNLRVKEVLASTTPGRERGMELRAIHSSSTPPGMLKNNDVQRKVSSTSQPNNQGDMRKPPSMGSSSPMKKPLPPPKPTQPGGAPPAGDNLGAAVWHGFLKLLGF
jgi:hypothetical protein